MADVLLAHSYFLKYDPKQREKMKPYPPLATLYAASLLRENGYSVALFDAMLSEGKHEFGEMLERERPKYVVLYEDSFNFLVKMCLSRMREAAQTMSAAAKRAGATVIAASPDVSDHPEEYFRHGVHYALIGEADVTLLELLDTLSGKSPRPIAEIDGLAWPGEDIRRMAAAGAIPATGYRRLPAAQAATVPTSIHGISIARTAPRKPERHLDRFPIPAWDLLDAKGYRDAWQSAHGHFSVNMVTTRGCPFHCNWCAKPIWGQRYAMRSPESVAGEMAMLRDTMRPDHVWFADDIFGLRPAWIEQFAAEIQRLGASVPFTIQSRVDLMTERAVAALKTAGCIEVWLGAESGSQKVLDAMDKGTRLPQIAEAREQLREAGIKASFFLQFGYPGETFEDIMATVQMVRDTLPDNIGVSVSYPLPGTKFHDMVQEQIGHKTRWTDSGDLAMMFQGTYRSTFYRRLHRLIHHDLELRQRLHTHQHAGGDAETDALLDQLSEEWRELGRLEAEERSDAPTVIAWRERKLVAPDLSKGWN